MLFAQFDMSGEKTTKVKQVGVRRTDNVKKNKNIIKNNIQTSLIYISNYIRQYLVS